MSGAMVFEGRVGLQQRVLPEYRRAFFEQLAQACRGGLSVFAGEPRPAEAIAVAERLVHARRAPAGNINVLAGPAYLCLQTGLLSWLRTWDPEVLILEASARNLLNGLAAAWMHRRGRPVIGWGLGAPPARGPLAGIRRGWRRRLLHQFDGLIAYSSRGARSYAAEGFAPDRIWVALNSVVGPPQPLARPASASDRPSRLLFVGRLQGRKRVDLLLTACHELQPAPEVWVVGDGPARRSLEDLAVGLGVAARFHGAVQGEALDELYRQADLFVLPGTGGLAVQEAMAHGLPVVVAAGDGTQEDLVRPENGWLIPADDGRALRETLRAALADPGRLQRMGRASHRVVSQEANIEVMTGVFVAALNRVRQGRN